VGRNKSSISAIIRVNIKKSYNGRRIKNFASKWKEKSKNFAQKLSLKFLRKIIKPQFSKSN